VRLELIPHQTRVPRGRALCNPHLYWSRAAFDDFFYFVQAAYSL